MASTLPLERRSVEEKLRAMESLWDDLCSKAGAVSSPVWHEDVLAERDAMHKRGDDEFEDWEAAKRNIRTKVSWRSGSWKRGCWDWAESFDSAPAGPSGQTGNASSQRPLEN